MLHFLTGMYYFTWFENLLIIIAGLSLGHFVQLIIRQVVAIRNHRPLTKIIRTMIPWLVILLVLMLSPVFASGLAVGWMVIFGILEYVIEQLVLIRFGHQLSQERAVYRPVRRHSSDRPTRLVHHSTAKQVEQAEQQSIEREHLVESSNSAAKQAQSAESAAKPAAPAATQPAKSAESAPGAEYQSPVVTNQAASTTATATTESQPETSAPESHQPTSQEIMDHMFDFDPNVDYEAEAKAAAAEADKQSQEEDTHDKN